MVYNTYYVIGNKKTLAAFHTRLGSIYIYHDIILNLDIEVWIRHDKCMKHFEIKKFDSEKF
jgi:hypothetical protein